MKLDPIVHAEATRHRFHVGREIGDCSCTYDHFNLLALRLETRSGLTGWGFGEKVSGGRFDRPAAWNQPMPDEPELQAEWEQRFAPALVGLDPRGALSRKAELCPGDQAFDLALRMALWDLVGKQAGVPLYQLFGGTAEGNAKFAYASPCGYPLDLETLVDWFAAKREQGFRAYKVKVGRTRFEEDLERLQAVRQVIGAEAELSVDANQQWTGEQALAWIRRVEEAGIGLTYVEDPCPAEDVASFRLLAEESPLRVVGHDYVRQPEQIRALLETGALGGLRLRDGLDYGLGMLGIAREAGLPCICCNTLFEINVHLAVSTPEIERIEFADLGWNRLPKTPVRFEDGHMCAPESPGHGFDPDPDVLKEWRTPYEQA